MIRDAIRQVVGGKDLDAVISRTVMAEMMEGTATQSQIASFITAMRMKGETPEELKGFVTAMRARSERVKAPEGAVDLCGTGGDCSGTFNISTVASFVVAAAGVPVAKHGNRSISSKAGSADLLSAFGIAVDLGPEAVQRCLDATAIGFMFAPVFHKSMKNVAGPRQEIGIRTFFNMLGPMTNPAGVKNQLIGVSDWKMAAPIATVLRDMGTSRALIVHGDGMDEITNTGKTRIIELRDEKTAEFEVSPELFGFNLADPASTRGGDPSQNARIALSILRGENSPRSEIVAMNAGAAIYVAGKAASLEHGIKIASEAIRDGSGLRKLREYSSVVEQIERERQEKMDIGDLSSRRILPEILLQRCSEISADLFEKASKIESAKPLLASLDEAVISSPSILSILMLNRILRIAKEEVPDIDKVAHSRLSLSESIGGSSGVSVIGEYKPRSPSSRPLSVPPDPDEVARVYASSDLAGVSVLVEPDYFSGSAELFSSFRSRVPLPMLFKDFVISENQLRLAQLLGADSVLLIAKALNSGALNLLASSCSGLGMEPLIELHDQSDLLKLASCECFNSIRLVGFNRRDLRTLKIDRSVLDGSRAAMLDGKKLISESGVQSLGDVRSLSGFDAVLVGSMLMQSENIESTARELVATGRSVVR
jgi:anthranilate phosphoribosyltransferase